MSQEFENSHTHRTKNRDREDTPYKGRSRSGSQNSRSERSESELSDDENPHFMMKKLLKISLKALD